jgi:CheY-like chemotaxis protein
VPEEETPSTVVFARPQQPAPQPPPAQRPAEVPLFIEEDEEEEPASTIVFAKSQSAPPQPIRPPAPVAPVVPVPPVEAPPTPPAPVAAPPAPRPEPVVVKPQPVVVPGGAKPASSPHLPPGMTAPPAAVAAPAAPAPKAEARKPEALAAPALPSDPPPKGEGLRPDQWLYLLDGAQRGPIDVEDLIDLVLTSIPENTKVWHAGLEGWVLANQVRQIAEEIPPPIPIPGLSRAVYGDEEMPDFNTVPPMLRTVLIADEDAAFRKYLAMPLAAQGFTIYEAADGSAAWQLAVQNRPWMILADISMPELDGFEFCRRVRSHPMLSRLPLLFISGSDKYKERYRALQIGADDFLSKNMPVRELLMRIQLLMTRYSDLAASEPKAGTEDVAGAFQGRIEVFGAPALLQMCAQGRLTGLFTSLAEDAQNTATVMGFRQGDIISATVGTQGGADAVYTFLAWTKGSFKFTPGDPGEGEPLAQSVEHLLLEGCRLLDESQKGGPEDGAAFA